MHRFRENNVVGAAAADECVTVCDHISKGDERIMSGGGGSATRKLISVTFTLHYMSFLYCALCVKFSLLRTDEEPVHVKK